MKNLIFFVVLLGFFASCTQVPNPPGAKIGPGNGSETIINSPEETLPQSYDDRTAPPAATPSAAATAAPTTKSGGESRTSDRPWDASEGTTGASRQPQLAAEHPELYGVQVASASDWQVSAARAKKIGFGANNIIFLYAGDSWKVIFISDHGAFLTEKAAIAACRWKNVRPLANGSAPFPVQLSGEMYQVFDGELRRIEFR